MIADNPNLWKLVSFLGIYMVMLLRSTLMIEEFLRNSDVLYLQEFSLIDCNKDLLKFYDSHGVFFASQASLKPRQTI